MASTSMINRLGGWAFAKAAKMTQVQFIEYVGQVSQELGVLTDEQYALMASLPQLLRENNREKMESSLRSLEAHISVCEYTELQNFIENKNTEQLTEWIEAKKDHIGTAGLVKKAATTFMSTISETTKKHLGAWYQNFRAPAPELGAFSGLLEGMSQPKERPIQRSSEEIQAAITQQKNFLIHNGTLMATAKSILGWVCCIQNLDHEQIVSYIEDVNQNKVDFKTLLFTQIDKAGNVSNLRKFLAKSCFYVLNPLIGFYVEHFTQNFLNHFQSQLAQFHNGHFTGALNESVDFLNDHLQTVYGAYENAAQAQNRNAAIDTLIQRDLAKDLHNGGMTRAQLYVRVAEEAVERFAPVSSLRTRVAEVLDTRIPEKSFWSRLNYPIAALTGLTSILITPIFYLIEWGGNALGKWILKKVAIELDLVPTLIASTGEAVGVGNEYKHALSELFVRQLQTAYDLMISSEEVGEQIDLSEFERNLPDQTRSNLKTFVSSLFLDLGCTLHSDTPASLRAYLEASQTQNMPEALEAFVEALGIPVNIQEEAKETTVKYLALLLTSVLKEEILQELTLTSLTTLNESCFTHDQLRPTPEQMRATEARRNKLLNDIITCAIRQAVNDKFYPMKRIQKEADQFVIKLHGEIEKFNSLMASFRMKDEDGVQFSKMETVYRQFVLDRDKSLTSQQGSANVNNHSLNNFNAISATLAEKLKPMQPILVELCQLEQTIVSGKKEEEALTTLRNIFVQLGKANLCQNHQSQSLMTQARTDVFPLLIGTEKLGGIQKQTEQRFVEISQALADQKTAQEGFAIAQTLDTIIQNTAPQQLNAELLQTINTHPFTSDLAETFKNTLQSQAKLGTLDRNFIANFRQNEEESMKRAQKTLTEQAQFVRDLETQIRERKTLLETSREKIQNHMGEFNKCLEALTQWAGQKEKIEEQIQALKKPQDASDEVTSWSVKDKLQPFQCQNTFPLDLTAFADTVQEFVVRQIAAYTNALPLFFSKDFNWEGTIHRLMVEFVNDHRPVCPSYDQLMDS